MLSEVGALLQREALLQRRLGGSGVRVEGSPKEEVLVGTVGSGGGDLRLQPVLAGLGGARSRLGRRVEVREPLPLAASAGGLRSLLRGVD